ncbi:MAG: methylated-DNA--[protein]-cysteine S-methyltransferase [Planctomycetota bacterium]
MTTETLTAAVQAALIHTPLGVLEVAWSDEGLCLLRFSGGEPGAVVRARYPEAVWGAARPEWVDELARRLALHLAGEPQSFAELPLDLSGCTPFQREVYAVCRQLPAGEVATYGTLAEHLGRGASSARAIGGAMAKNPLLLIVPCHRVVGSGGLTGFNAPGGLETKRTLLELEGWQG